MSNTLVFYDVMNFQVEEYSSTTTRGAILHKVDYAKETKLTVSGERIEIRGGQGNYKIISIDHSKSCTFSALLPLVDIKALQVKLGKAAVTGAATAEKNEILSASAANKITLSKTPLANTLKIYKLVGTRDMGAEQVLGTPGSTENAYSISSSEVTLNATTAPVGAKFYVTYSYTTGATADKLKITANNFPTYIRITGEAWEMDDVTAKRVPCSFNILKCIPKLDFELNMTAGAASELNFECDCDAVLDADNDITYVTIVKKNDEAV
jgi:hypothetical protein